MSNIKPVDEVRNAITKMAPQFQMALPKHIPTERFMRVVQTAIGQTPALLKADRTSLYSACMKSAQSGLLPDGKEAALVMFGDKVTFMPMIAGVLKQVRNSGELASITSQLVYEQDAFNYWIDADGEHIEHRPNLFGDRGKLIGVYALAKMKDGAVYIEVLTMDQVEAIKKSSRSAGSGPWAGPFYTEMVRKSSIRRLAKRLPLSTDLEATIKADDDLYEFDQQPRQVEEPKQIEAKEEAKPSSKKPSRLGKLVKSNKAKEEVDALPLDEHHADEPLFEDTEDRSDLPI